MARVAISGFGRIGRCVLRAMMERKDELAFQLVAINEPASAEAIAYLTRYDTNHGRFPAHVALSEASELQVGDWRLALSHETSPKNMPWAKDQVDLVLECSGAFSDRSTAEGHLHAGADKVLFSQPAEADVDATIIMGVNENELAIGHRIVSAGSCTTNCVVPVIQVLDQLFGVESGSIRTLHAAMNDQPVMDAYHNADLRKNRAAHASMIPVDTGLALGVERVMPQMKGRFEARAMRIPLADVSAIDLTLLLRSEVGVADVNAALKRASNEEFTDILGYTEEPLVSCDFVHNSHSAVVDGGQTSVAAGNLVKVLLWFDNEWGFANRMLDIANYWVRLSSQKQT